MRLALLRCAWPFLLSSALAGCAASADGPVVDDRCGLRAWYRPAQALSRSDLTLTASQAEHPELIGSWDGFARPGLREFDARTASDGQTWDTIGFPLPPGPTLYGLIVGNYLLLDDIQPQSAFAPDPRYLDSGPYEAEFSLVQVPVCSAPTLTLTEAASSSAGQVHFVADFQRWVAGGDLDATSVKVTLQSGGALLSPPQWQLQSGTDPSTQQIVVSAGGLAPGKYTVTISAAGQDGQQPPPVEGSVFVEAPPSPALAPGLQPGLQPARPLDDAVVYQIIVDRFAGPSGALAPPPTPGARAGGTLSGVMQAVEAGYFQRLGVTTLWLSPLYQNPSGLLTGLDGHLYEAYHGYWPTEPRTVEPQLGGESELQALVAAAHARGLRVLFDAVPNHVYEDHPYYLQHSRQVPAIADAPNAAALSWFNDGPTACVCGTPNCSWSDRLEDCWFDTYLPDLNWRNPAVMQAGVADLLWWLQYFDLDGMRIDAVPMMPRATTRRIVYSTRQAVFAQGLDSLIVGEDYTGPGLQGRIDIRSFLGSAYDGLDSAFDFPLMWAIRSALATEQSGLDELEQEIASSQATWAGSGAVMAHILGNHDTTRFISEAVGDADNDPWSNPPPQPSDSDLVPYRKMVLGLALLLTLPGIPVLYYGDEVGLAGAGDPDSRRVLPAVLGGAPGPGSSLSPMQAEVLQVTARLGKLRTCLTALRRGTRTVLASGPDFTVALHALPTAATAGSSVAGSSSPVLVVLSRSTSAKQLLVPGVPKGRYSDALSGLAGAGPPGPPLEVTTDVTSLVVEPLHPAIYTLVGDPCLGN